MKVISIQDAVAIIPNGASLMVGGFMGVGTPERLIDELVRQGKRRLTVIANDTAMPGRGIGKLVAAGLTYCLSNPEEAEASGYPIGAVEKMFMKLA